MTLTRSLGLLLGAALIASPAVEAKTKKEYRITCKDGATSRPGQGACSGHGGIDKDGKSGVLCADGKFVEDKANACKDHDGYARKGAAALDSDKQVKARKEQVKREAKDLERDAKEVKKDAKREAKDLERSAKEAKKDAKRDAKELERDAKEAKKDAKRDVKDVERDANKLVCSDGTIAKSRLGCFGHGGVAKSDVAPREPAVRGDDVRTGSGGDEPRGVDTDARGATARCKDGKYSHSRHRSGACSNHGGVDKWLDETVK